MKEPNSLLISIILVLLPVIPALLLNFHVFIVTSAIGFLISTYYFVKYLPWKSLQNNIISIYFTGIFAFGLALGVFLALPAKPRDFAAVSLVESIPFFISFLILAKSLITKVIDKSILRLGNGYFAALIVIIIGAIIGRFLHNFYELIILYSGFIALGIITYLYFKE
ncbi:hypothetical protein DFR86_03360 [Acidianus sulfidivorans JP7]|uniref:Uncharacterized protein n=1 Tax=Acidianus sulfidivorans JP7 TaxID=619593 RepID=A0A2U9IKY5_9CREN|nr:hypothetical protein [Acidianus sulfidivorans]AWR96687.1 hypothetical protein DFR86_03360 [Acidianus sulfidivorans JP7]